MMRILTAAIAAIAAVGATMVIAAAPAQAARSDCQSGYFCAWYYGDYTGPSIKRTGNASWPGGSETGDGEIRNDDLSWYNHGTACSGCDHVRIRDWGTSSNTLCVHRGAWGSSREGGAAGRAANRGDAHTWGGECSSGEPQLN